MPQQKNDFDTKIDNFWMTEFVNRKNKTFKNKYKNWKPHCMGSNLFMECTDEYMYIPIKILFLLWFNRFIFNLWSCLFSFSSHLFVCLLSFSSHSVFWHANRQKSLQFLFLIYGCSLVQWVCNTHVAYICYSKSSGNCFSVASACMQV